jgi:hypothetical protein
MKTDWFGYLALVVVCGLSGAALYFAAWLCVGFEFRGVGLLGGALAAVAAVHVVFPVGKLLKEA